MYCIYLYSENDYKRNSCQYGYWSGKSYTVQGEEYPVVDDGISEYNKRKMYKSLKRAILGGKIAYNKYCYVTGFDVDDEMGNVVYKSYKNDTFQPRVSYDKKNDIDEKSTLIEGNKEWTPREGYALTLDEIHFLFNEYLSNYNEDDQLETRRTVRDIEDLRSWLTNAAIKGERL